MQIVLFEGNLAKNLEPITLTRPSFDILTGGFTLFNAVSRCWQPPVQLIVRSYLKNLAAAEHQLAKRAGDQWLFLNAALVPDLIALLKLKKKIGAKPFVIKDGSVVLAAFFSGQSLNLKSTEIQKLNFETVEKFLLGLKLPVLRHSLPYFVNLWDVITQNQTIVKTNAVSLGSDFKKIKAGVYLGRGVVIEPSVHFDVSAGPVIIGDNTKIKTFSILRGPLVIGKNCVVNSFTEIKDGTCLGDYCKVGGEIEASIIQGYSNKQHYGFLGHSYVGAWVNLGAGTTNSDLKSTYGLIKMQGTVTGRQFLGVVIADYCKAAVGSLIYSGKVIGVNSFIYGRINNDVPSFTSALEKQSTWVVCPLAVALKGQKAMMARRQIKINKFQIQLLNDIFYQTEKIRRQAKIKNGKLNFNL